MLNNLVKYAEIIRNKYKFEIDCTPIDAAEFFKLKSQNDKMKEQQLCNNLYKKIK